MPASKRTKATEPRHVPMQSEQDFEECAARLKALADPDRLRIVTSLLRKELSVSKLADELQMPIDKASHHLSVLRAARLVQPRKEGKFVVYSVPPDVAITGLADGGTKTIDLGCCQLDLVQPTLPKKKS